MDCIVIIGNLERKMRSSFIEASFLVETMFYTGNLFKLKI